MKVLDSAIGQRFRVKGESKYFQRKYGTPNPIIQIEGTDQDLWGKPWTAMDDNIAALLYEQRTLQEGIPSKMGKTYGGNIEGNSELVHESELGQTEKSHTSVFHRLILRGTQAFFKLHSKFKKGEKSRSEIQTLKERSENKPLPHSSSY